jgi:hypothetical protein
VENPEIKRAAAEIEQNAAGLRAAERPLLQALAAVGIELDSVWDLYKFPEYRSKAIPVLLDHVTRDYPDKVLLGIGIGLDHKSARARWVELKRVYLETDRDVVRDRLAAALSGCASKDQYADLLSFLRNDRLGETRIYFLRPINRIGNRMSARKGRAVMQSLVEDPILGKEATAILRGRGRNE